MTGGGTAVSSARRGRRRPYRAVPIEIGSGRERDLASRRADRRWGHGSGIRQLEAGLLDGGGEDG